MVWSATRPCSSSICCNIGTSCTESACSTEDRKSVGAHDQIAVVIDDHLCVVTKRRAMTSDLHRPRLLLSRVHVIGVGGVQLPQRLADLLATLLGVSKGVGHCVRRFWLRFGCVDALDARVDNLVKLLQLFLHCAPVQRRVGRAGRLYLRTIQGVQCEAHQICLHSYLNRLLEE